MSNNKVSEKAIWEGSISPDNDVPSWGSQMQTQPQMMFCYKCNNVIPNNSKFCPYCQIKLFTECPKCGTSYSSQYPACGQCGTNREEYLQWQRKEQERKEAIERENRRQREILERKRSEEELRRREEEDKKEQEKRLKTYEQQEKERRQKNAYLKVNAEIMKTREYETTYSLLTEALDILGKKGKQRFIIVSIFYIIGFILGIYSAEYDIMESLGIAYAILGLPMCAIYLGYMGSQKKEKEFLLQYISRKNNYDKDITNCVIDMIHNQGRSKLSECCIYAYRKTRGLPIDNRFLSLY